MIPSTPIRGRVTVRSALSVDVLIAVIEGVDVLGGEGDGRAEAPCEMHGACDVLAHDRGLDGVAWTATDGEDSVAAHEHGRRAVAVERVHDPAANLRVADQRERADGNVAAELVGHRRKHTGDRLP